MAVNASGGYPFANQAVILASARYLGQLRKIFDATKAEGRRPTTGEAFAATYLLGIYDMARLYIRAKADGEFADELRRIDAKVIDYTEGGWDGEEEQADGGAEA